MDEVSCACASCDQRLGQFFNLWIKIGKSYISPVIGDGDNLKAPKTGPVRLGEEQTLIENCHLQDISCLHCLTTVGLRCLDTPVNHVLHNDQLFLRLSSVKITAMNGDDRVQVAIQRTLKLRDAPRSGFGASNTPPASESSTHTFTENHGASEIRGQLLDHLQAQLDAQREEIQRLNRSGFQMASSFDNAVLRVEGDIKKLRESMEGLQEDLKNHHSNAASTKDYIISLRKDLDEVKESQAKSYYSNIELELASAKQTIENVRLSLSKYLDKSAKEQQEHKRVISDLNSVQRELKHFRGELDETKKTATERISAANTYTTEVVSLRAELKELREELAQERSQKSPPTDPEFPAREIDILTTNITKIGQKASQVETLQMELELLKERLQRVEKTRAPNSQDATEVETPSRNPVLFPSGESRQKWKRSSHPEETTNLDMSSAAPSSERPTRAPPAGSLPGSHDSMNSPPFMKVRKSDAKVSESPRLTKSGTVDKRYLRRGSRRGSRLVVVQDTNSNG